MTNVAHASLTGASLHEPKGISTASSGQVYVANGAATGAWTSIDSTSFTGQISDFCAMTAPSGWLELDGSTISTSTYANLFGVMSLSQNGTRTSGSAIITGLGSTSTIKAGYYVFGTGITTGTTVLSVDSGAQITMSANAGSSGTSTVIVSPWLLNTGTIKLPDLVTSGRYRRSRTSTTAPGQFQADQNQAHTHTGTTNSESATHTHSVTGTSDGESAAHTHSYTIAPNRALSIAGGGTFSGWGQGEVSANTSAESAGHTHTFTASVGTESALHTHSFATGSSGSTETRPLSMVFITCVKT